MECFYQNKEKILNKSLEFFLNSNSIIPKIGIELEFFLLTKNLQAFDNQAQIADFIFELKEKLLRNFSLIYQVEKEQGVSQIEIKTIFTEDLLALCYEIENLKNFIEDFFVKKNLIASFIAQPFSDDCGSALQINISLHEKDGGNLFEFNHQILNNVIVALLDNTDFMMVFLAPKVEDYLRFSFELNRNLFKKGKYSAPINLSFGSDNRSCAIRVPPVKKDVLNFKYGRRIEYRIPAAGADSFLVISAILLVISHGIKNDLNPYKMGFKQIFGNAFDEQYEIKNFCQSLEEAEKKFFIENNFIRKKMTDFLK